MNLKNVFALCGLFLIFGYEPANSTSASIGKKDHGSCSYSKAEEHLCGSYCFKSLQPSLAYIMELREQMKATAQTIKDKDNKILELSKRFLETNECRDQVKANIKQIEYLNKTNEDLRKIDNRFQESVEQQNQIAVIEQFITNTINNQKAEIEDLKLEAANNKEKNSLDLKKMEKNLIECEAKISLEHNNGRTNDELRKIIERLRELQNRFANTTINNQKKVIEDLKHKVARGKKNSVIINYIDKLSRASCKGLPSGFHLIKVSGLDPFPALCNGDIAGGGWMVIHRRISDGIENFERNWTDFRNGFGGLDGEFFIGLEPLHRITNLETYELYLQIEYFNGDIELASYDNFRIGNEDSKYKLESLGEFKGSLDQMKLGLHHKFSTIDHDNDNLGYENCATHGAWWYNNCLGAYLNGRYYDHKVVGYFTITRFKFEAYKSSRMLIRPKSNV